TWAVRFRAVEYSAPMIGSKSTVVVIATTPSSPPVHNQAGSVLKSMGSNRTVPSVAHVRMARHSVPTMKEMVDMTHGEETETSRRLLIADWFGNNTPMSTPN